MRMSEKTLFQIDDLSLAQDLVLVDYIYPVLFTCVDNYGQIYIVTCYLADGKTKEWIIARSDPDKIINLLQDKISMRDIFLNTSLWQAVLKAGETTPAVTPVRVENLDPCILPTPGEFMDADPNEFDDEIKVLSERRQQATNIYKKTTQYPAFVYLAKKCIFHLNITSSSQNIVPPKYNLPAIQEVKYCVSV